MPMSLGRILCTLVLIQNLVMGVVGTGRKLLCYMVVQESEVPLLEIANKFAWKAGPFKCDRTLIFGNEMSSLAVEKAGCGRIDVIEAIEGDTYVMNGGLYDSRLNTPIFLQVWHWLRDSIFFSSHITKDNNVQPIDENRYEWIVKIDPDTCFFPDKLKKLLRDHDGYKKSTAMAATVDAPQWIPGPIEVLSFAAMNTFLDNLDKCEKQIDINMHSEDLWLMTCINDNNLISSTISDRSFLMWYKVGGFSFYKEIDYVARHPLKNAQVLRNCYRVHSNDDNANNMTAIVK